MSKFRPDQSLAVAAGNTDHEEIDLVEALSRKSLKHAAHCMLWCSSSAKAAQVLSCDQKNQHYLLMQVRSDGTIGFPGGFREETEEIGLKGLITGLNRELVEELSLASEMQVPFKLTSYICSHLNASDGIICHFFHNELTEDQFERVEREHMHAKDFPTESLGVFRVPVTVVDKYDGHLMVKTCVNEDTFFANFRKMPFCGNSNDQMVMALKHLNIVGQDFKLDFPTTTTTTAAAAVAPKSSTPAHPWKARIPSPGSSDDDLSPDCVFYPVIRRLERELDHPDHPGHFGHESPASD